MSNEKWVQDLWEKIDKKLSRVSVSAREKLPYTTDEKGEYDNKTGKAVTWWTNGFWSGMMWLMYDGTKKDTYRITAERGEQLLDEALKQVEGLHHDVGFMWHLSAGANYRLTGNRESLVRNFYAANVLAGRYNLKGGYIRAWNGSGQKGFAIIDCMMNIPLLYWASETFGDERFKSIAMAHADKTMKYHVREDGSVNHIVNYDPQTGEVVENLGGQGYAPDSSWSRGQAWGLYGFTLSYIHTKEERYLQTAKKIANYFIAAVCDDWLPKCDFRAPAEPVIYDTSAGLIAASGLLELAKVVPEYEQKMYYNAALNLIKAITERFADWSEDTDAIITHGTEAYNRGMHKTMVYSDYYLVEAVNKLMGFNTFLW